MCAQWTNLGGVIFQFFGKHLRLLEKNPWTGSWNGRLVNGWSTVGQRSVNGRSTVGQRSVNGRSTVGQRLYPRLPPDDCWSKNAFLGEKFLAPEKSIGAIWTPPTAELSQKMLLRQPAQGNDRAQAVRKPCVNAPSMRLQCAFNAPSMRLQSRGGGLTTNWTVDQRRCRR